MNNNSCVSTNCGFGNNWIFLIVIILICMPNCFNGIFGGGCGGNDTSWIIILILLFCCCGNNNFLGNGGCC